MKVKVDVSNDNNAFFTFTPECIEDETALIKLSLMRVKMWSCRGVKYMNPEVEFLLQKMPSD